MAGRLVDTNVIIAHLRTPLPTSALLSEWVVDDDLLISVITRLEVLAGMAPREEAATMALLQAMVNLPVTDRIADLAGRWIYAYARRGVQVSLADALIAATAVEHDLTLVTSNAKHFPMPELKLHPWSAAKRS